MYSKYFFLSFLFFALGFGLESAGALGSSESKTTYDFQDFDSVVVEDGIHIDLQWGPTAVKRTSSDRSDRVEVYQKGRTLIIHYRSNWWFGGRSNRGARFAVSIPSLRSLTLSGGSTGSLDWSPDRVDDLEIELSGGSQLEGGAVVARLTATLSGGSQARLTGNASPLRLEASGGSWLRSPKLMVKDGDFELSGGSGAVLKLEGVASVEASGGSTLEYTGSPALKQETSGGSSIRAN